MQGIIINPRGASGAGKTELVRRIIAEYERGNGGRVEPVYRPNRTQPIGYRLLHPLKRRPLAVLGHYGLVRGGCDTIGMSDGGMEEVFRIADDCASSGHDVLLEGLLVSHERSRTAELARRHRLHVLHLATPLDRCIRNVIARRRARRDGWARIARTVAEHHRTVAETCETLRSSVPVETLDFDAALLRARDLLGLNDGIAAPLQSAGHRQVRAGRDARVTV